MSDEAENITILSGNDIPRVDSSQPQHQEINTVDIHHPHMSIDELLKVIKGANGMPVLFVPSNDGRLAAVAVNGLQNLAPPEKDQQIFRAWLLLLASLIATVTFTAGLAPPGGFWADDDKAHVAGTPIMRDKFYKRYLLFYYSNTTAFFSSLMAIGMLAKNKEITVLKNSVFRNLVAFCFVSLGTSYIVGVSPSFAPSAYGIALFLGIIVYLSLDWYLDRIARISRGIPARGQPRDTS